MLRSAIPLRFALPWAKNAAGPYIRTVPVASQIGVQDGAASFNDGFVPDNFTPLAGGGVPPFGQDFNGVMNVTTSWDQWYQAGAPIAFDSSYSTAIGGYPQGAILDSALVIGKRWVSLADGNTTDPDDPLTSTNWRAAGLPSGTPQGFLTPTLPNDHVAANGLTIGNASSNATALASASALFLYAANWLQFSNTQCPILTSAGAPSTRGANPYADFAANKQLTLPDMKGLGIIGADTMGGAASTFLSGVPATIGNSTTPGSILGENLHALSLAENGPHTHPYLGNTGIESANHDHGYTQSNPTSPIGGGYSGTGNIASFPNTGATTSLQSVNHTHSYSGTTTGSGSGTGHNTVHRSMVVFWGQIL
ncbi:hypothetical protein LJR220_003323 [Bradyrhizobium sp. LjRoot220]|uniref:hypothetical protein n=1 Tax=Bradyrhizobium sp. LjRoot220 TaxID=3342284 RepID=UPI003ECEC5B3